MIGSGLMKRPVAGVVFAGAEKGEAGGLFLGAADEALVAGPGTGRGLGAAFVAEGVGGAPDVVQVGGVELDAVRAVVVRRLV